MYELMDLVIQFIATERMIARNPQPPRYLYKQAEELREQIYQLALEMDKPKG